MTCLPDWAHRMTDLHVHAAPSLVPRHGVDTQAVAHERELGFETVVLKSHEGSTAERAFLAGDNVYGGIVLNSTAGGANPDAVEVAARLGGRIVWMPTVSASNHIAHHQASELAVHRDFTLRLVEVVDDGRLLPDWYEVIDVVARYDLVLASGHLTIGETLILFAEARRRGVTRLMVNHPLMPFIGWVSGCVDELRRLEATLELGILPDILSRPAPSSITLADSYPAGLLVFGGDLGHAHYPQPKEVLPEWLHDLESHVGARAAARIMVTNGRELLLR